jgi:hypothetical protein
MKPFGRIQRSIPRPVLTVSQAVKLQVDEYYKYEQSLLVSLLCNEQIIRGLSPIRKTKNCSVITRSEQKCQNTKEQITRRSKIESISIHLSEETLMSSFASN